MQIIFPFWVFRSWWAKICTFIIYHWRLWSFEKYQMYLGTCLIIIKIFIGIECEFFCLEIWFFKALSNPTLYKRQTGFKNPSQFLLQFIFTGGWVKFFMAQRECLTRLELADTFNVINGVASVSISAIARTLPTTAPYRQALRPTTSVPAARRTGISAKNNTPTSTTNSPFIVPPLKLPCTSIWSQSRQLVYNNFENFWFFDSI